MPGDPEAMTVTTPPMAADPDVAAPMLDIVGSAGVVGTITDRDDVAGLRTRSVNHRRAPAQAEENAEQDYKGVFHVGLF